MRIGVAPVPREFAGAESGSAVVVIDVFRASTTIAAALAGGARFVLPVADVEQAMRMSEPYDRNEVLLGGERECQRIDGFQLGNSPLEYTREAVAGKVVIFTTSNGTRALAVAKDAATVIVGSFVNFSAVADAVAGHEAVTVLCAGNNGRISLEDFICAGGLVNRLAKTEPRLDDAALAARAAYKNLKADLGRTLAATQHALRLADLGFRADLEFALKVDSLPIVPRLIEGRIVAPPA
ncbi:2-phosphosulfolactate phosphatase [candidate division WOR-3 bacterium]|uniref:Probable 2-phosphosulfolactate phosphatase n=1 Tax=candidate division WOR-3 bacterium TaxID=2052148 RepID=A0A937XDS0_UNCW3|nr:2-phosphosulfolactate phosphatase [candidate division WOR-3 bacterium]